jgi:hypothetical protein
MMKELSAYVSCYGDPSVGIHGISVDIDLGVFEFESDEQREMVREHLRNAYSELWDDHVNVTFSDEWSEDSYTEKE